MERHASRVAPEPFVEIDSTCVSERWDHAAVACIDREKKMSGGVEDAAVVAVTPIRHATTAVRQKLGLGSLVAARRCVRRRIEAPKLAAHDRVERDKFRPGQGGVDHAANYERVALHLGALVPVHLTCAECPGRR